MIYVSGRLHEGHFDWKVLKNSMRAFSNKIGLNMFYRQNKRFALVSVNTSRPFFSGVLKKTFLPHIIPAA